MCVGEFAVEEGGLSQRRLWKQGGVRSWALGHYRGKGLGERKWAGGLSGGRICQSKGLWLERTQQMGREGFPRLKQGDVGWGPGDPDSVWKPMWSSCRW